MAGLITLSLWMYTMNRCFSFFSRTALLAGLGLAFAASAQAQFMGIDGKRKFPVDVERGKLVIKQPPYVMLDGKQEIMAPGVRVMGLQNTLVLTRTLVDQNLLVNYRRNDLGQIKEVWLLTDPEAKTPIIRDPGQMKPLTARKARRELSGAALPYDQLPTYEQATRPAP